MNGWLLSFDGYDPEDEARREALCTLGNGMFASRGAMPECRADGTHYPGTYAAGVYDRVRDQVDGQVVDNESMVNLPNWLPLDIEVEGTRFDPDRSVLLDHQVQLDLRSAVLVRSFRFVDDAQRVTAVVQRRLVHMGAPHLAALHTSVTAENWTGELVVRSGVDAGVRNAGVARYERLDGRHLGDIHVGCSGQVLYAAARTLQSQVEVAVGAHHAVTVAGVPPPDLLREVVETSRDVHETLRLSVDPGTTVAVDKVVCVVTSRFPACSQPLEQVLRELAQPQGFDTLLPTHLAAWASLWQAFGLELELDEPVTLVPDDMLRNVRVGLLHLLQSVSPHSCDLDVGVPARGLHGEAYRGHVFWDELFIIPFLAARHPGLARSLLLYRYRRLPEARRAARSQDCRGACFPWQSGADGTEQSQRLHLNPASGRWLPDATYKQRHVGLAVALSVWRYVESTRDTEFLCEYGAELMLEVAMYFADAVRLDPDRQRFVLHGVVGPDEFHTGYPGRDGTGIDDNAYTNVLVAWLARTVQQVLTLLPDNRSRDLLQRLGVTEDDLALLGRVATRMYLPFHGSRLSQFEGYDDLDELDWASMRKRYGDIRRLDRLLEAEGRSVNDVRASKQADVLMLFYVLSVDEVAEVVTGLGYEFDRSAVPETVDYYLARTSHGSTLSSLVHSWVLARSRRDREAIDLLLDVVHSDVDDVQGGTTGEGVHLAAMCGGADLLLRCFAGLEPRLDALHVSPEWPEGLGELRCHLRYQDHELDVLVGPRHVRVASRPGPAPPVVVRCRDREHRLAAGQTVEVAWVPMDVDTKATVRAAGVPGGVAPRGGR